MKIHTVVVKLHKVNAFECSTQDRNQHKKVIVFLSSDISMITLMCALVLILAIKEGNVISIS